MEKPTRSMRPEGLALARACAADRTCAPSAAISMLPLLGERSSAAARARPRSARPRRSGSMRAALVALHRDRPGEALDPRALLEAGWPGERVLPDSGAHRVHVAVSALRKMGLHEALERFDAGYRLAPAMVMHREPA